MNILRFLPMLLLLTACASLSNEELAEKRGALDTMGEEAVARLIEQSPELKSVFDDALGYLVADMKVTKVPVVGGGAGKGVVVDQRDGSRKYIQVARFDVGGGWGIRSYKLLMVFTDEKVMKKAASGSWNFEAGAEAAAGTASAEGSTGDVVNTKGFTSYTLSEGGASATVTARVVRVKPYLK